MTAAAAAFPVSYSRLSLYRKCPKAYQLRYLEHVRMDEDDVWLRFGRAVHTWFEHTIRNGEPDADPVLPAELAVGWPAMRERALGLLAEWRWTFENLIGVEETLTYGWRDERSNRPVVLTSKLDALVVDDTWGWQLDWKTGYDIPSREQMSQDLQLMIGALVVMRNYPRVLHCQGTLVFLRHSRNPILVDFTREAIDAFELQLRAEVSAMMADTTFTPSPWCDICPPTVHINALQPFQTVWLKVSDGEVAIRTDPITDALGAHQVALSAKIAEALAHACKRRLDEWSALHGPVALGKGAFGHWYQPSQRIEDLDKVVEIARAHEIPLSDVLNFNLQRGKKYLSGKLALAALQALVRVEEKTKFDWKAEASRATPARPAEAPSLEVLEGGMG